MQIDQIIKDNIVILQLTGDIDSFSANYLKEALGRQFSDSKYDIVVDLTNVDFVDSAGLGQLVSALKLCVHHNGNLMLVGVNDSITDLLKITKLDTVFRIYNTVDEAVEGFNS